MNKHKHTPLTKWLAFQGPLIIPALYAAGVR